MSSSAPLAALVPLPRSRGMETTGTQGTQKELASRRLGLNGPTIAVESASFAPGAAIPPRHAGANGRSPALRWSPPPRSARELLILCEDPDAPTAKPFVHWILTGLPPDVRELSEGQPPSLAPLSSGAAQGKNDMKRDGYYGPEPPPGHGVHHYHFQIFAVDRALELQAPVDREQLVQALRGHVVAWGELVGTFER